LPIKYPQPSGVFSIVGTYCASDEVWISVYNLTDHAFDLTNEAAGFSVEVPAGDSRYIAIDAPPGEYIFKNSTSSQPDIVAKILGAGTPIPANPVTRARVC
jgi:hypothetical protein